MRALPIAGLLLAAGCSRIYQPNEADRPSSPAEVDAHFSARYDAMLDARATCSGTTFTHARTLWLGPKDAFLDRQLAVFGGGEVRLDRPLASECLAAIASAVPACTVLDAVLDDPAGACSRSFAGVLEDGAECASDAECHAGSRCLSGSGACPGHCTPDRAPGEVCEEPGFPCGFGLRCGYAVGAPPVGEKHCFDRWRAEGEFCGGSGGAPCGPGLRCNPDPDPANQLCVPLLGGGAAGCASSSDCRPELFCNAATCETRIPVGWTCTPSAMGQCVRNGWCDVDHCVAFAATGSCGTQGTGEVKGCLDGECIGGSCVPFATWGGACAAGQSCAPLGEPVSCIAGSCAEHCE
jgi:hypothetical protein